MSSSIPVGSGAPWSRGLRPLRALAFEACRTAIAAVVVATLVFAIFQIWLGPAGPLLSPHDPKYAGIAAYDRQAFALDQPAWTRFGVWMTNLATGNLGLSFYYHEPVTSVFLGALPVSLELLLGSALWALLLGGLLGWGSASPRHRMLGSLAREGASVLYGIPVFVTLVALLLGTSSAFRLNFAFASAPGFPEGAPAVTGFPVLDSLLTGDLTLVGGAFATSALLSLVVGLAFAMPVAHRVRQVLEARRTAEGMGPGSASHRGLGSTLGALAGPLAASLGVLTPFLLGAVLLTEVAVGRRGVGFLLIQSVYNLDGFLLQGEAVLVSCVALAIALPLSLIGAGLARSHRPLSRAGPTEPGEAAASRPGEAMSPQSILRRSRSGRWILFAGLVLLVAALGVALLGPVLAPYGPLQRVAPLGQPCRPSVDCPLSPPSSQYPLGVDFFGRDIFSRVLWGGVFLVEALAFAVCVAAGLGLGLGLLPSILGRGTDLTLRAVLGAIATIPVLIPVLVLGALAGLAGGLVPLAVGLLFVPVVFRDVRDRAARTVDPGLVRGMQVLRPGPMTNRAEEAARSGLPGFLALLPRRAAEMTLLIEAAAFLGVWSGGAADWAGETAEALNVAPFPGLNPLAVVLPAMLLAALTVGMLLVSDGLRALLEPTTPRDPAPRTLAPDANP